MIGCGKSTFLNQLRPNKEKRNISIIDEPLEYFCRYKTFNPLSLSYQNPIRYSAMAQVHIIQELSKNFERHISTCSNGPLYVSERCLTSALPFIKAMDRVNYITDFDREKLIDFCLEASKRYPIQKYFFIDCPRPVCIQRIKDRARSEEKSVSLLYLNSLFDTYQDYLSEIAREKDVYVAKYDSPNLVDLFWQFSALE